MSVQNKSQLFNRTLLTIHFHLAVLSATCKNKMEESGINFIFGISLNETDCLLVNENGFTVNITNGEVKIYTGYFQMTTGSTTQHVTTAIQTTSLITTNNVATTNFQTTNTIATTTQSKKISKYFELRCRIELVSFC